MAVLALGFVGEYIGAQIGGTILGIAASSIGGFIGSTIGSMVDNMLFPQKQEGPRLSDLKVQVSTYGKAIPRNYGPENRIAGNVFWSTGLIETKHKSGGKGAPSVQVTTYTYRASFAVLLGEGRTVQGARGIRKVWANSKLIFDADEASAGTGTAEGVFDQVQGQTHDLFDSIQFYPGTFTQLPDPTIEGVLGVGQAPAYRGRCYVVIKDLQLADFGNRLPNLEFLLVQDDEITVGAIAQDIVAACGIDPMTVSAATLRANVRGFSIGTNSSGTAALQPLSLAFDFDSAEVAGSLRFYDREAAPVGTIPLYQLGAHVPGDDRVEPITWSLAPTTQLPREANVTFIDPDRDFQQNSQVARRSHGSSQNNLSNDLPVTLTADEGRKIADRMLWEAWTGRTTGQAQVDDRWIMVEPGRRYALETPSGAFEPVRITRRARGANGIIELDLRRDRAEVYQSTARGSNAAVADNPLNITGPAELILLDIPLLADADDNAGFYYAVTATGFFRGADVVRALTISDDFDEVAPVGFVSTVGAVTGTLATGTTGGFDDVTILDVVLRSVDMELVSVSDDAILGGANACFVGNLDDTPNGELIQFGVATQIGPGHYQLTHLRRGLKGTEFAMSLHTSDDTFVLLEPSVTKRANYGFGDVGLEHAFKAVPLLKNAVDIDAILFTNTGVGLRPLSPVNLVVTGSTGADLDLSWVRRSRLNSGALGESEERYTLRIMNALGTVVVREVSVTTPDFVYTLAMQTADFGGAVADLRWRVAQVSGTYGNGIFEESNGPVPT